MLLTLTTTYQPATDLGYLLHKNPGRLHSDDLSFGRGHVFYSQVSDSRCAAHLLLEVDPIKLVRNRKALRRYDYVNDRPYVASSFLSVAIARLFSSALNGSSRERPDLAATPIPLEARLDVVRCRGGEAFIRRVFEPLAYAVTVEPHGLEDSAACYSVTLQRTCRLQELLEHLYVLVPVLDDDKHYWVGEDEVEKLLRRAGDWLAGHPFKEQLVDRYLKHRAPLRRQALSRLLESDDADLGEAEDSPVKEESVEKPLALNQLRLQAVAAALKDGGAHRVLDLGCGEGQLVSLLLHDPAFTEIVGLDVASSVLERASQRLHLGQLPAAQAARVKLLLGSLTYRDRRLEGYDAAAVVEVVEHLDLPRLAAFERVIFEYARPRMVLMTTPNAEFNRRFAELEPGELRHPDHRFEWTRTEFEAWCGAVASRSGYSVGFRGIGDSDPDLGPPTQMAVFSL
jgi:3' terminal RNA ribose 2'-O-methyltransferase Hen1